MKYGSICRLLYEPGSPVDFKPDRKSTRLNSSHVRISYAVFCLKKKKQNRSVSSFCVVPRSCVLLPLTCTSVASSTVQACLYVRCPTLFYPRPCSSLHCSSSVA